MDLNLQYWQSNGTSFLDRLRIWLEVLDPSSVLSSAAEIENARSLLHKEETPLNSEKIADPWRLSLSSVHPDSGAVISHAYRPLAFLPMSCPLVIASFVPHVGMKPALFWQFLLHSYYAGFNYANRNTSAIKDVKDDKLTVKQSVVIVGAVAYTTAAGVLPQILINRFKLNSTQVGSFFRTALPIPLSAALAAFNVFAVRSEESEKGIQVFDSNGNPVGVSKVAGSKAVRETAVSRAVLLGTTATVPNLLVFLLARTKLAQRSPMVFAPVRYISTVLALGLMVPVSFSLFPQLGKIKKERLEEQLQTKDVPEELYYHRGL